MISRNNKYIQGSIFSLALLSMNFMQTISFAQDKTEKHRTYINIEFTQSDRHKKLEIILTARIKGERGRKKVADAEIEFYAISDTSEILLGKSSTGMEGVAILEMTEDQAVMSNSEGEFAYNVLFKGNEDYGDVSKRITLKEVEMVVSFIEVDSVKNIAVSAYQKEPGGEKVPVEEDVLFYVPRQFSLLKIGEVELQNGNGNVEFPVSLPGDSIGNLNIIARIEESRNYGTVEAIGNKDWGKPRVPIIIETRRGLGDTDAPLWMVYTLIVLLSAVWFHYVYIFYLFFSIKRKGKQSTLV